MYTNKKMKGQATVEYLVLLAVAIIVALVIFAFMGWVPGFAGSLKERQSKLFWSSTYPIQIRDYKITNTTSSFLLQNVGDSKIEVTAISMNNQTDSTLSPSGNSARLAQGQSILFTANGVNCSVAGDIFEFEGVSITYDTIGGIQDQQLTGDRSLVGRCLSS